MATIIFVTTSDIGRFMSYESFSGAVAITYLDNGYMVIKKVRNDLSDHRYFYTACEAFRLYAGYMSNLSCLEVHFNGDKITFYRDKTNFEEFMAELNDDFGRVCSPIYDIIERHL